MTAFTSDLETALAAARSDFIARNPASAAALEAAAKVMPGGNTRSSLWADPFPLSIKSGEGCRIVDVDGRCHVDFLGEFTAGIFGHSAPPLAKALAEVHADGINLSSHTPYEAELAGRVVERFPSIDLLRFTNSGTEANLMAVTTARLVTGRPRVVVFSGGYHGGVLTFGHGNAPVNVPFDFAVLPFNDVEAVTAEFAENGARIAAVLVEPMQGAGGCVVGTQGFLQRLRDLTSDSGAILIFDEVQTARMSTGGAQQLLRITPDMTTLGKFFGGGLAFGAFGGEAKIMQRFDPARADAIGHAGTFNNNRLTMAAGLAALDHYLGAEQLDGLYRRGETFRRAMADVFLATGDLFIVTGMGSIMNIHGHGSGQEAQDRLRLLNFRMLEEGYYFAARGLIALSLAIGEEETEGFLRALRRVLS